MPEPLRRPKPQPLPRTPDRVLRGRPTGPPKRPLGQSRTCRLTSMVRPVELASANLMAQRARVTVSEWVRSLILASIDPTITPQAEAIVQSWLADPEQPSTGQKLAES